MKTILFPHTEIFSIRQFPLFLLAPKMRVFQPATRKNQSEMLDCFMKAEFCQVEPLPFDDKEEERRFLQLDKELRIDGGHYPLQLSGLALAARTGVPEDGEQSERAIRSGLASGSQAERQSKVQRQERIWQARLLLSIGAILDWREEEVAIRLARVESAASLMIDQLQGELTKDEKEPLYEVQEIQKHLSLPNAKNIGKRASAWCTLFADKVGKEDILLSFAADAIEPFLIQYEKITGQPCHFSEKLPLPIHLGRNAKEAITHCNEFSRQYDELQKELATAAGSEKFHKTWNLAIDTMFPADSYGRQNISVLICSDTIHPDLPGCRRFFFV